MSNGTKRNHEPATSHKRLNFAKKAQCLGMNTRQTPKGPESRLVEQFLNDLPLRAAGHSRLTLFQEPRLESGFPDIVAVYWHEPTTFDWNIERSQISSEDVRIVHLLATHGPQPEEQLEYVFQKRVRRLLKRLADIGLVINKQGVWRVPSVRKNFAVRRIVAFEAKISDWRTAINQASLNKWFTSESYVLLPKTKAKTVFDHARNAAVGVWYVGDKKPVLPCPPENNTQPISYASWLFNEWVWRCALKQEL